MLDITVSGYEANLRAHYRQVSQRLNRSPVPKPVNENPARSDIASDGLALRVLAEPVACGARPKEWISAQDYVPPAGNPVPAYGATTAKAKVMVILNAASKYSGQTTSDILSQRHHPRLVRPRHIAMYLCHKLTTLSYPKIGEFMGRDHSTIVYGVNKLAALIETDQQLAADVAAIRALAVAADPGLAQ